MDNSKSSSQTDNHYRKRIAGALPCFALLCSLLLSCHNDMEKIMLFDRKNIPQQALDSVRVLRSNFGNRQMSLTAPYVVMLDKPEKMTVFPRGFDMHIYDGDFVVADIRADSATSIDSKKVIKAHRNVVIVDHRSGDTTYLDSIVWESASHFIYSRAPVKSVNGQRVTYGEGFESDDNFTAPQIFRQRGTMTIDD